MSEIISVISGKGGVGKTTVVSNLAVSLTQLGKNVLVIDANVSGANLGIHLGVPVAVPVSLNDVLRCGGFVSQAIYKHRLGFSVIPASLTEMKADSKKLRKLMFGLLGGYDFIIIDAGVGVNLEVESAIRASDKVLIVTNPELPALTNAAHAKRLAEKFKKDLIGIVVNKKNNDSYELTNNEIAGFLGTDIISVIPEHKRVRESIALGKPVVDHRPHNESSFAFNNLARKLSNHEEIKPNFLDKIRQIIDGL